MTVDASKVRVAITGALSKGLTSATAPTGASAAITGFNDLGGISETFEISSGQTLRQRFA